MFFVIAGMSLFLHPGSFSHHKVFPTPEGFTTDPTEALKITLTTPLSIEKNFRKKGASPLFKYSEICDAIQLKNIATVVDGVKYLLRAGYFADGSIEQVNREVIRHHIKCVFVWTRGNRSIVVDPESPHYYIYYKSNKLYQ